PRKHSEGQFGANDSCTWRAIKLLKLADEAPDLENEENVFSLFIAAHLAALRTSKSHSKRMKEKVRILNNLQSRKLDQSDGQEWYRLIDFIMTLPEEMNKQVHEEVYRQHTEDPMKYVSFAEREGIAKGLEKGREEGIEQGELMGQVRLCQELLKQQPTPKAELLALSQEDLAALLALLRHQLLPNGNGQ